MEIFEIKLAGANAENARKLLLTLLLFAAVMVFLRCGCRGPAESSSSESVETYATLAES